MTEKTGSLYSERPYALLEVTLFGMGFGEMLLIMAVALVVIGPKKLPGLARTLGRGLAEFRRYADDIQRTVQREIHAPLRDDILGTRANSPAQKAPGPPPEAASLESEAAAGPAGAVAPPPEA